MGAEKMTFSPESREMLQCYVKNFPWIKYISRSRPDLPRGAGVLRLHEGLPEQTERGGFCPTARCIDLYNDLFPEIPEGVCVKVEEVLRDRQ